MNSQDVMNSYSDNEFRNIVLRSSSYSDCLRNLGYDYKSSARIGLLKSRISELNIDVGHFNSRQINGGKSRAFAEKENARKRIDEYNRAPNVCLNCGEPILAPYGKNLNETKNKKFCSKSCSAKYSNSRRISHSGWVGISKTDSISDDNLLKIFNESNSIVEFKKGINYKGSLSKTGHIAKRLESLGVCLDDIDASKTATLKRESMTKGELFAKRKTWQSARGSIQRWAQQQYEKSDKPKYCLICNYPYYEIAHITAVSDFPDCATISEINSIDNLIALCRNHHYEYDNDLLTKEFVMEIISKTK